MPWARIDDSAADHRKFKRAGLEATGLYWMAISYCARYLTDGYVDRDWLEERVPQATRRRKLLEALETHGLFEANGDGYHVHDYLDYNPTAETIEGAREHSDRRSALHRDRDLVAAIRERDGDLCRYCGSVVDWTNRKGSIGGTYDHVIPRGPNTLENVVVACRGCNSSKGHRTPKAAGIPLLPVRPESNPNLIHE